MGVRLGGESGSIYIGDAACAFILCVLSGSHARTSQVLYARARALHFWRSSFLEQVLVLVVF